MRFVTESHVNAFHCQIFRCIHILSFHFQKIQCWHYQSVSIKVFSNAYNVTTVFLCRILWQIRLKNMLRNPKSSNCYVSDNTLIKASSILVSAVHRFLQLKLLHTRLCFEIRCRLTSWRYIYPLTIKVDSSKHFCQNFGCESKFLIVYFYPGSVAM